MRKTARSLKSGIKKNTVSRTSGGKHNESKKNDKSDVDTFKVGDIIKVKLTDGVKVQAMASAGRGRHDFLPGLIACLVSTR